MDVPIYDIDGSTVTEESLPSVFETAYRPDLIQQAVSAMHANASQPYGTDDLAGLRTPAESFGAGRGMAMVPRSNNRGKRVPQTVGGRRAHPPTAEADRSKDINDTERQLATRSAIAATADPTLVAERGHAIPEEMQTPIVLTDDFETLQKTKTVVNILEDLSVYQDIERADSNRSRRAGKGTMRGRARQQPSSILFVTSVEAGPSIAARNLAGADVATAANVSVRELAPGGHAGRLTVFSESALEEVSDR